MKHAWVLMMLCTSLACLADLGEATTYYVPSGIGEVRSALAQAQAGDRVEVSNNDLTGENLPYVPFTMVSGVEVVAATNETPLVDASDTTTAAVTWPTTASSGTVLEGFTIRGGTQYGAEVRDEGVIRDCTIENTSAPQYLKGIRSVGSTTIDGCSISLSGGNGDYIGIYHTGGAPNIQNCSVAVSGGVAGIQVDCPSATTTGELAYCSITVDSGDGVLANTGSFSMHDLDIVAAGYNNSGIKAGYTVGELRSTISDCLVSVPGGVGIWVVDDSVEVTNVTVDNVGEGIYSSNEAKVTNCIVTNYDPNGYGFDNVDAVACIAGPGQHAYETGSKGTGSVTEDPLYCDDQGGEYTLRIDSYGNPDNPDNINNVGGALIGAFPVACMYGTLERDSKYSGAGSLEVPSDVTVPQNRSLTISSNGADLEFLVAPADPLAAGADTNRVELIVNGILEITGSGTYPVKFKSSALTPGSHDWGGIWLDSHGEATIDHADIADATRGIQSAYNHDLTVTNSSIAVGDTTLFAISATRTNGNGAVNISGNNITVGESASGIKFYGAGTATGNIIQDNVVSLDDLAVAGLVLGGAAPSSSYPISGNVVSGGAAGKGVELEEADGDWKVEDNTVTDCLYGMYVDGVTNTFEGLVGGNTSAKGNSLTGCSVGFVADGDQVLGILDHNDISSNSSGVRVMNDANPDLGDTTQGGYNRIVGNTNYCIRNTNTSGTISAWHNYFGDIDCEDPPVPTCLSGAIDINHILCTDPASVHMEKELVGREVVLRAFPNPLSAGSALEFNLAQPGRAGLLIFDISGRLVRDFGSSVWSAGRHTVHWDGSDGAGRSVGDGIYFVKLATDPGVTRTVKLLVAR